MTGRCYDFIVVNKENPEAHKTIVGELKKMIKDQKMRFEIQVKGPDESRFNFTGEWDRKGKIPEEFEAIYVYLAIEKGYDVEKSTWGFCYTEPKGVVDGDVEK
ncbi:hypothetical protein QQS21_007393 [Conoideocrella luteorostrata]|uniref:Uncharacterized protein n=1 Tax=Conoideocrella luteorostrata TaxID=1105319 RepID=A0AAJ0CKY3_9HYPO|nr:hypothetical protein QQS21_007393 [Conoideocrella luteorostrata]